MSHKYVYVKVRRHIPAFDAIITGLTQYGYRVSLPEPNATITLSTELDETGNKIKVGWAVQSPHDRPNKKLGRTIADGRLKHNPIVVDRVLGTSVEKLVANADLSGYSDVPALHMMQRLLKTNTQPTTV